MRAPHTGGTALITGASEGIGAIYADRLARRGHDLVLVARSREKLEAVATKVRGDTGRHVEVLVADLATADGQRRTEQRLQADPAVEILVNNAGINYRGPLPDVASADLSRLLELNIVAVTRLAWAALSSMKKRGHGTIINLSSALAILHMPNGATYSATKAFVLTLTQALSLEPDLKDIRFQAVLPGATRTEIWAKSGTPISNLPPEILMDADEMVDAALAGLDQGELVTIPSLPDTGEWERFEAARHALGQFVSRSAPASRYRAAH